MDRQKEYEITKRYTLLRLHAKPVGKDVERRVWTTSNVRKIFKLRRTILGPNFSARGLTVIK